MIYSAERSIASFVSLKVVLRYCVWSYRLGYFESNYTDHHILLFRFSRSAIIVQGEHR